MFNEFNKFIKSQRGFTLVELLVVISILGVLAAIAVPKFTDSTASARGGKIIADLQAIDSAIQQYGAANYVDVTTATITSDNLKTYFSGDTFPTPGTSGAWKTKGNTTGGTLDTKSAYEITAGRATFGGSNASQLAGN